MKLIILSTIFILLFYVSNFSQNEKSEREADGLKDSVKSVITEIAYAKKKQSGKLSEHNRRFREIIIYDNEGNRLTRKTYDYLAGTLRESIVYSRIDGDTVEIYEEVNSPNRITQINPNFKKEKETSDPIYRFRFIYQYDKNGNLSEKALYHKDGSLWLKYVYQNTSYQIVRLAYSADGSLNQKYISILDSKGNVIERHYYDIQTNKINSKETFEYLEFDAKGNWKKMITYEGNIKNNFNMKPRDVLYQKLTYF